jgi:hypothetical protein
LSCCVCYVRAARALMHASLKKIAMSTANVSLVSLSTHPSRRPTRGAPSRCSTKVLTCRVRGALCVVCCAACPLSRRRFSLLLTPFPIRKRTFRASAPTTDSARAQLRRELRLHVGQCVGEPLRPLLCQPLPRVAGEGGFSACASLFACAALASLSAMCLASPPHTHAHTLHSASQALLMRDVYLCWFISITWELVEIFLTHMVRTNTLTQNFLTHSPTRARSH